MLHEPNTMCNLPLFLFLLILFPQIKANLNSENQALLDFAASIRHGEKINWNKTTSMCTSWSGVTCSSDFSRVVSLRLPAVGLRGSLPPNTLGKLTGLISLSLRSNALSGEIPTDILSLPSLKFMYLQNNNFSGDLPDSLPPRLVFLDLSHNSFAGRIPSLIENSKSLKGLNLQNNSLTGTIPDAVNLISLKELNLSFNNLTGSIPSALRKFPESSFQGNLNLCGEPLKQCSSVPSSVVVVVSKKKPSLGAVVAVSFSGFALLLFLLVLFLVFCCLKKKFVENNELAGKEIIKVEKGKEFGSGVQEGERNKLVFLGGCSYSFDLEDLLRASAEVLGKGSCGTSYKAILEEGNMVVVKRLKEVSVGKREFEHQMMEVVLVQQQHHPNVVPILAYYYSKDEKLVVSDYFAAGTFSKLLHGTGETGRTSLDWDSRLKIMLGAAKGVSHIHSATGKKLVHGNIKSSNVLLSGDLQASSISDFGLASLTTSSVSSSRSPGYRAPEVVESRKSTTQKSDVYSFGVLLLEMLTGKAPVQYSGHDDVVDLPRWVQSVVREEWTAEVFDLELMRYPNIEEELVQMLQLAMACVAVIPDTRPSMEDVVRIIEEIIASNSENQCHV